MIRSNPSGDRPEIAASAFIDPTALVCGKVRIDADVFVGPYAVIRADETTSDGTMEWIHVGSGTNIQDGVVIHSKSGAEVTIGSDCSIAHRAIVHGPCILGTGVFIGFNSTLFGCHIGNGVVVRHNAVVENCDLPARSLVPSSCGVASLSDVAKLTLVDEDDTAFAADVAATNVGLAAAYKHLLSSSS